MRITGGIFGGRTIKVPKSDLIRPTTDRVRESLFNSLANIIDFEGISVCDIYAGSGALGFECLSRGAAKVHFVEKNYVIYKNLISNISSLDVKDYSKIFKMEAVRFAKIKEHEQYDLIIADPPFFHYDVHEVVKLVLENNYLTESGLMIVERSVQTERKDVENFKTTAFKKIGDSLIYRFEIEK